MKNLKNNGNSVDSASRAPNWTRTRCFCIVVFRDPEAGHLRRVKVNRAGAHHCQPRPASFDEAFETFPLDTLINA